MFLRPHHHLEHSSAWVRSSVRSLWEAAAVSGQNVDIEQDKTIAEMKSIIENLQDIVYQRKLDKEAENLVL